MPELITNFFSDWRKFTYGFRFLAPLKNGKPWHPAWYHSPLLSRGEDVPSSWEQAPPFPTVLVGADVFAHSRVSDSPELQCLACRKLSPK